MERRDIEGISDELRGTIHEMTRAKLCNPNDRDGDFGIAHALGAKFGSAHSELFNAALVRPVFHTSIAFHNLEEFQVRDFRRQNYCSGSAL